MNFHIRANLEQGLRYLSLSDPSFLYDCSYQVGGDSFSKDEMAFLNVFPSGRYPTSLLNLRQSIFMIRLQVCFHNLWRSWIQTKWAWTRRNLQLFKNSCLSRRSSRNRLSRAARRMQNITLLDEFLPSKTQQGCSQLLLRESLPGCQRTQTSQAFQQVPVPFDTLSGKVWSRFPPCAANLYTDSLVHDNNTARHRLFPNVNAFRSLCKFRVFKHEK